MRACVSAGTVRANVLRCARQKAQARNLSLADYAHRELYPALADDPDALAIAVDALQSAIDAETADPPIFRAIRRLMARKPQALPWLTSIVERYVDGSLREA